MEIVIPITLCLMRTLLMTVHLKELIVLKEVVHLLMDNRYNQITPLTCGSNSGLIQCQTGTGNVIIYTATGLVVAIMECTLIVLTVIVLMLEYINRVTFEISLNQVNVYFVNEKTVVGVFSFRSSSSNRELFCC